MTSPSSLPSSPSPSPSTNGPHCASPAATPAEGPLHGEAGGLHHDAAAQVPPLCARAGARASCSGTAACVRQRRLSSTPLAPAHARQGHIPCAAHRLVLSRAQGVIHRDLKPENILLADDTDCLETANIKIIDWGTGDFCAPGKMLTERIGSPGYTAPEASGPTRAEAGARAVPADPVGGVWGRLQSALQKKWPGRSTLACDRVTGHPAFVQHSRGHLELRRDPVCAALGPHALLAAPAHL
jgi:hypothetical protein